MRTQRMPWAVPLLLTWLMLGMSLSMFVISPNSALSDAQMPMEAGLDEPTSVSIQVANGSSSALKAEVPVGHTVESIDLSLSPDVLAYSDGFTWSGESDWNATGAILDQVEVNKSTCLEMLPRLWSWDFEGGSFSSQVMLQGNLSIALQDECPNFLLPLSLMMGILGILAHRYYYHYRCQILKELW